MNQEHSERGKTEFLTGPQVAERYKISGMTLYRWLRDPKLAFPQPMVINRRKFFNETELTAWERDRAKGAA
ncbi:MULTISPECIES: helix-turn-helix transcriptional regulator [Sinorhizobium]|uniref:helix-turn-helix transcriptional regulator n=1 Tax=Sinorhizobium TaxID=28105 RepID=UPI0003F7CC43|nr:MULTISPECIES: helix-turn-helix domain-containing protein [Sinorhizobium]MDX0467460.1 DNA-binding protein [Sinorhizobium medicae]MDX0631875.1 DNA-binding protein [Sinorhizobium medicae]MDX1174305.1 DNA-binding protein [Sinorhizobium medicae]MDX1245253.1 DNA-binding protein [Sinorhizobium medicae]MQV88468.1 DNA-binding protein [Sinorhizobium medicae]